MENIVVASAKYMIIILMVWYTYKCFSALMNKTEQKRKRILRSQNMAMFWMHFISYMVTYIKTQDEKMIIFYGCQLVYFILTIGFYSVFYDKKYNPVLVNNMCMLLCISFIMLTRLSYSKAVKQFVIVVITTVLCMIIPWLFAKWRYLKKIPWIYCGAGLFLLSYVLILGRISYGAKLSVDIAGFSFQPSEFVKILYILFVAAMFEQSRSFKQIFISAAFAAAHVIILVLSTDLGTGLIFCVVYLFMLYVATSKMLYFLSGLGAVSVASVIAHQLFGHVKIRVLAWRDPWSVIDKEGFQITQSLFAIGTGGWLGMGLYEGIPDKIPVVVEDFMFSAIAEELGSFFAIALILICLNCFLIFIKISVQQTKLFYKMVGVGLAVAYGFQIFLTIGGAIKLIPSTGVTLPLVSYGGSSILSTMIVFAMMQGLSIIAYHEEEKSIGEEAV